MAIGAVRTAAAPVAATAPLWTKLHSLNSHRRLPGCRSVDSHPTLARMPAVSSVSLASAIAWKTCSAARLHTVGLEPGNGERKGVERGGERRQRVC